MANRTRRGKTRSADPCWRTDSTPSVSVTRWGQGRFSQPARSGYGCTLQKSTAQVGSDARYRRRVDQPWLVVLHALAVLSLLGLALLGQVPAEVAGWLGLPAVAAGRVRGRPARWGCAHPDLRAAGRAGWRALGAYLLQSWRPVLLRSLLLWGLWAWSGEWGWSWLRLVPWALWLWRGVGLGSPGACVSRQPGCGWRRGCGRRSGWCCSGIWRWC